MQAEVGSGRLVAVTVTDMPPVRRQIVVARRRDGGAASPVLAAFLATLDDLRPSAERSHRFLAWSRRPAFYSRGACRSGLRPAGVTRHPRHECRVGARTPAMVAFAWDYLAGRGRARAGRFPADT